MNTLVKMFFIRNQKIQIEIKYPVAKVLKYHPLLHRQKRLQGNRYSLCCWRTCKLMLGPGVKLTLIIEGLNIVETT